MIKKPIIEKTHVAAIPARPPLRGRMLKGTALTASLLAIALSVSAERAYANPQGGTVVVGDATITPIDGGDTINIDQGSDRIIIDWTSFSIDEGETVNFDQLNAQSIALNRVTGFETSYINGVLTADGFVFLINQNGIVFGRTAFVDVGGLVATTADISNDNFMAGNYDFDIASPNEFASIVNEGMISVADTGLAALVAPSVRNSGIISANLGTVGLAGARTFTLDFYGDGLFSFDTGSIVQGGPEDGSALVENTGVITADGGYIGITALAAEDIVNNVINLDGVVEANTIGVENGTIVLSGGDHGTVNVSGTISATGDDAGELGGTVHVLGDNVVIDTSAIVDASGHSGGGDIRIGGGLRGGEGLQIANTTTIEAGANILADATHSGDGGSVVVWADSLADYNGSISARGGADSGDGGFVEVSADDEVLFHASVDVGADNGLAGELLIDPNNFTVTASVSAALEGTLDTGASITVEADNDVFIANDIDGSTSTVAGGGISISSGRSTSISTGVTVATNDGDITVTVNDDARNGANRDGGTATFTNNGAIDSNGGNVTIQNGSLSATADVDYALGSIASDGGVIAVSNTVDDITINTGTLDGGGGNISVTAQGDITVGDGAGTAVDAGVGGDVLLSASGNIIDGGNAGAKIDMSGGGTLTMIAGGSVGAGGAIDTSGSFTLEGSAGGNFYISNSGGDLTLGDITATGGFIDIFNISHGVAASGSLTANSYVYIAANSLTITGEITGASINLDTNAIDIQNTLAAGEIAIDPTGGGVSASFNASGVLDLTNAELAFLDSTGTVSIGTDVAPSSFVIGDGTDLSGGAFDLTLETSGTMTFADAGTALSLADGTEITLLSGSDIDGGGTNVDIFFAGAGNGTVSASATGVISLNIGQSASGEIGLNATSGGKATFDIGGDVSIGDLDLPNVSLEADGDITIETGTIQSTGDVTLTSGGTLTIGDASGIAINASGDVTLDATNDILDGGAYIQMYGGTLTLDAGGDIGANNAHIQASGAGVINGTSGASASFYLHHTGDVELGNILVRGGLSETLEILNDGNVTISGIVSAVSGGVDIEGDIIIESSGGPGITNSALFEVTASGNVTIGDGAGEAVDSSNGYWIAITSENGAILDGGGSITVSDTVLLSAGTSIGQSGSPIDIAGVVSTLFAEAGQSGASGGDMFIDVSNSQDISSFDIETVGGTVSDGDIGLTVSGGGVDIGPGGLIASGDVTLDIGGEFYTDGSVTAVADIALNGGTLTIDAGGAIGSAAGTGTREITVSGADFLSLSAQGSIDLAHAGNVTITTGSIHAGGDVDLDVTGNLTIGTSTGTAIDASGGVYDVALSATGNIVDGAGVIDMSGGGTLTLEAGGFIGTIGDAISTTGSFTLQGTSSGGRFDVFNNGGTLTVANVDAGTDVVDIGNVGDIIVEGAVDGDASVIFVASGGSTLTISASSSVTGGVVTFRANSLDIQTTVSGSGFDIAPTAGGIDMSLGGSNSLDLTNAELDFLNTTGTVTIGATFAGDLAVGSGIDISDNGYDLRLESGGTLSFDQSGGTALTVAQSATVTLIADEIVGDRSANSSYDIAFTPYGDNRLDMTANNGDITIETSQLATLNGTATGAIDFLGYAGIDLVIEGLVSANADIVVDYNNDVVVETGTVRAATGISFDLTRSLTIGDGAGVAIDASAGGDVVITASSIIDGGGIIDMSGGGTLTLDADDAVGASGAAIEVSSTANLFGSAGDGDFYVENSGGTLTVQDVSAIATTGVADIVITNDGDIDLAGTVSADGDIQFDAGSGSFDVLAAGAATAGQTLTVAADAVAIGGTLSGADIDLDPTTNGTTIGLGTGATGDFNLSNTEIAFLSASGVVTIGNTASGDVDVDSADFSGASYDLTLLGTTFTFDDADAALTMAQSATIIISASGAITGGGTNDDIVFTGADGALGFEAVGDVTLDTVASTAAGSATGSIDLENTGDLEIGSVATYTGLTAVNGSASVEVHSDLNVTEAINASTSVTLDANDGNVSITAEVTAGTTATFISDTIHIADTVTAADINLETDTAAQTIGVGAGATGNYNLTNTEIAFLSATGVVTIGTTQSGAFDIDSADFTGAGYDLTLQGGAFTFDDADVALALAQSSTLLIDAAGAITGGGNSADVVFTSATGSIGFTAGGDVTLSTEANLIAGTTSGDVTVVNTGDLEVGSVGSIHGIWSGGSVSVAVHSDIDVTEAINATGDVTLDTNGGVFTNTGSGSITSAGDVIVEADGMSIGADIEGANITLRTDTLARDIEIADASTGSTAQLEINNTELDHLSTSGVVTIGRTNGSGTISVDSIDVSDNGWDLTLQGGDIEFVDGGATASLVLASATQLLLDGDDITALGTATIEFSSATGAIGFTSTGDVDLATEASLIAGSASGTITIDNTGDLEVGTVAGFNGLQSGGSITVEVHSDLNVTQAINATNTVDLLANTGNVSITAAVTAGGTATVISDTIHIGATLSGADIFLETDTDSTTIGIGTGTGTFNLTETELKFLNSTGMVTIGNAQSGDVDFRGVNFGNPGSVEYDLTVIGDSIFLPGSPAESISFAEAMNVHLNAAGSISGGTSQASVDMGWAGTGGNLSFEAGGDVTFAAAYLLNVAGTASGSIDIFNANTTVVIGSLGGQTGLTSVNGSIAITNDEGAFGPTDIDVTEDVSAATSVTLESGTGSISITAAIDAGTTATFISDTIHIGGTVTAADAFLRADSNGTTIGLNNTTGTYNLTEAELQNLSVSGTVTIGTTQSGDIAVGGLGNTDLSGEDFDLVLNGGTLTVDDDNVGLTLAQDSSLTLDLSGSLSGGGANVDFAWGGTVTSGVFDFATDESATVLTSQVGTLDGTALGAIAFENSGPGTLNINSLVSSGAGVTVTNSGNVVVETGTLGAAGDIAMSVTGDITLGDGFGEAIDASSGGDVTLTASGNVIDGGGSITMGGGTLTFDAGGGVGTSADRIDVTNGTDLNASAGAGGVYVDNAGGTTLTVHSGSATAGGGDAGNFEISNVDADIIVDGFVNVAGTVTITAGTGGFENMGAGSISAGLDVTVTADVVAIGATISADDITLQPTTPAQTVGLSNASGTFNLTNAEMDLLDSTGLVTVGRSNGTGDIFIGGAGTFALDDNDYDFLLRGGDVYFSDLNTALQIGGDQSLGLDVANVFGGGSEIDIAYIGGGGTLAGTTDGIVLNTSGLQTLTMVVSGNFELINVGDLDIDELRVTGGTIKIDNDGDVEVETNTLVTGGDTVLTVSQTLTIGDTSGVAIDASGGVHDVRLDVGLDIVDGGAIIDMSGGGTLTMDAGHAIGSAGTFIRLSGTENLEGSAGDGVFFVRNTGGNTMTVLDVSQTFTGVGPDFLTIENVDADLNIAGTVDANVSANFGAGSATFSVESGGQVSAGGTARVIAADADIAGTVSAGNAIEFLVDPASSTIGLSNSSGSFNLTNAEFDFFDTTGEVRILPTEAFGRTAFIGGAGTLDLSDNDFNLALSFDNIVFADSNVALRMSDGRRLTIGSGGIGLAGTISGGGTMTDVAWSGTTTGQLNFNSDQSVDLTTEGDLVLTGEAGDYITYTNTGTLSINHLESTGGPIDVTNAGDTTVETGTIIVFDTLTMDVTGDLFIGNTAGTAIDASSAQTVILSASGSIIDGEGIIDLGGTATLQMDAGRSVGTFDDAIKLTGGTTVTGSSDDGEFSIRNDGGTTLELSGITATTGLSGFGNVIVANDDADIVVNGPLDADDMVQIDAGSGEFSSTGTGEIDAGGWVRIVASDVDIQATISADGGINLEPNTTAATIGLNNATGTFNVSEAEFHFLDTDDVVYVGAFSGTGAIEVGGLGTIDLTGEDYSLVLEGGDLTFDDDQTGIMMAAGEVFGADVHSINGGGTNFDVTFPDAGGGNPDGSFVFGASGTVDTYISAGFIAGSATGDINITNSGNVEIGQITLGGGSDTFTITGVVSGGSIDIDVESDLLVTANITAADEVELDTGDGAFTNSGNGSVTSTGSFVEVIADTVNIGATISATAGSIVLMPSTANRIIGLGSSATEFNLTDSEFDFLVTNDRVTIGNTMSGSIFIGDVETIDLTAQGFDLQLEGGEVTFDDSRVGLRLAEDATLRFNTENILGGGNTADVVFTNASGGIAFDVNGTVTMATEASLLAGTSTANDVTIENTGNLEIGSVDGLDGLVSGGTVSVTVHSDLTVTEAVTATSDIFFDAGTGDFSNSGSGTVFAGGDLEVNADTVALGATMTADNITIQPDTGSQSIGLNDASGGLNLTEAELQLLASSGDVTIGAANGTGAITIGSLGGIDLSGETYDLLLRGGDVSFADNGVTATLELHGGDLLIDGGSITSGGSLDVAFTSATGSIGFTSSGVVTLVTEASLVAGEAVGSIDLDNTGDLEVGTVRNLDGLQSGGSITVAVHSDLDVTQAINATNDILLDANTGNFANTGLGSVSAGGDVTVEATTIDIGATISGANINLRPNDDAATVGLNDASGTFNLDNTELDHLKSGGTLTIGRETGTGGVFVGSLGTVDLSDEAFELEIQGGALTFADTSPALLLREDSTATFDVAAIIGGGTFTDVKFTNGNGGVLFDVPGDVDIKTDGSILAGTVGGHLIGSNAGSFAFGTVGGFPFTFIGGPVNFGSEQGTVTVQDSLRLDSGGTLYASGDIVIDGAVLNVNSTSSMGLIAGDEIESVNGGSLAYIDGAHIWLEAENGVAMITQGVGAGTLTIGGETANGDFNIFNATDNDIVVGSISGFGSGISVTNAPGAGGDDIIITNQFVGGGSANVRIEADINAADAVDIRVGEDIEIVSGAAINSTQGGFISLTSRSGMVAIEGVINATGTGAVMINGDTGINGTGTIQLDGNSLGLTARDGDIDANTQGTAGSTFTVAAAISEVGDITIENTGAGDILIDEVAISDGVDTGVAGTITGMVTPDGDITLRNLAGSASGGNIEVAAGANVFAGAAISSGNVTFNSSNSGIVVGNGASVTGTVSVSFTAAMDIAIGDNADVVSGGPLNFTAGGSITTGDSSEVRADGDALFDAVGNIEIGQTATVAGGGTLTLDSSAGSIDLARNSTVTGDAGLLFSADQRVDLRSGAFVGSDAKLRFTAGAGITIHDNGTVTSSGSGTITAEDLIVIGNSATVHSDTGLEITSNAGGINLSANATVTGGTSVGLSASADIDLGADTFVSSGGPLGLTAGGSITTGDSSEIRSTGSALLDAVNNIEIGQMATVAAGGTLTLDSSAGSIDLARNSTATGGAGLIFSADQRIDLRNGAYVGSDDKLRFTAGAGITIHDNGTVTSSGSGTITAEDLIVIGNSATVHSDTDLEISSNAGGVVASTSASISGGTSLAINASTDITLEGTSFVGAPDIKLDAGNDITTEAGSTVEGTNTILFDAGNDIITNGTTDASAGGTAVTLLAGRDIIDGGNTFVFTDGTLRADAGRNIDLTLSGTGGATVTAALNAGGNIDIFLRDDGDLTFDAVSSSGGTTSGVTAGAGYVNVQVEDGLVTINEDVSAANTVSGTVTFTADDLEIFSTVTAGSDIFIEPFTDGRGIALNDGTANTLNLANAEVAFLNTVNTVQFGRVGAGDIFVGGSGSLDFAANTWAKTRFFTDGTIFMTNGVESRDTENLFDTNVVLTGATVIDTVNGGTGADVNVTGTIEGTAAGAQSLTITSGAADITFDSMVGQTTPLGALDLSGNNITVTDIQTIGTQTYTALGEVTFGSDYLTNGFAFFLSGGLTLADDVLVDTTIPAGTGANITIDDVTNNGYTLTLNAGNDGFIELDTWTNTGAFENMGVLNILDSDTTTINGTLSGDTMEVFDSTTLVSLLGDVDLQSLIFNTGPYAVNITGSNVFLVNQISFNNLGGTNIGDSNADVFVFGGGADANASNINVQGDFTFGGIGLEADSLSLGGDVSFDTDGGDMMIGSIAGNGFTLVLDGGNAGDIVLGSFTNPNGGGQTGILNIINANTLLVTGEIDAATLDIDTLQTSGELQGMVTVDDLIVGPGGYSFSMFGGALVTNFVEFLNTGGVHIGDEATDLHQFLAGATSTASPTTMLGGTVQSEGSSFTFGDLILYADTVIDSTLNTPGGQDINFNGTINSAPTTAHHLVVVAGHESTATFVGNVGDITPIGSLDVSALDIILHDVTTVGSQIYNALDEIGRLGQISLNSSYVTMGGDFDMNGDVDIADDTSVDTTYGGEYAMGDIFFGGNGGDISFQQANGTLTLMSGGSTTVRSRFAGSLGESNTAWIYARDDIAISGGRLGEDLFLHAGAFDGEMNANPGGDITSSGVMTVGDFTSMTATGDITFLGEFNTYALRILLNGHASSTKLAPVNITEVFEIAGLTFEEGSSDLWGSIRGSDTESASALGDQLELVRRDDFLFNDCIVEVGCLNFDPSAIVLPVFDPVIYLYERDGEVQELRYSDLPNTEIWFGFGGAPDIWEERLGRDDEDEEGEE